MCVTFQQDKLRFFALFPYIPLLDSMLHLLPTRTMRSILADLLIIHPVIHPATQWEVRIRVRGESVPGAGLDIHHSLIS